MILVDTSVWIDYLRHGDALLVQALEVSEVLCHPVVIGELACGNLSERRSILGWLHDLPQAIEASHAEVLAFIEQRKLHGLGIGYADTQLLASTALSPGAALWTRDKRLQGVAQKLALAQPGA